MSQRRALVASFVVTMSSVACSRSPPTQDAHKDPQPPEPDDDPAMKGAGGTFHPIDVVDKKCFIHVGNPPAPIKVDCPKTSITKDADGKCIFDFTATNCPPGSGAKCNPPPPQEVDCPQ